MGEGQCLWAEDEDGVWQTSCDNAFVFACEGPSENDMRFCCYCGKPLTEQKYIDETEAENAN